MLKKEFLNYIKSFNKEPGEYTEDEVYEIGLAHKQEMLGGRDWTELAKLLGVTDLQGNIKTGDSFRCWVKARQIEDGTLPKNNQVISERTVGDLSYGELNEKLDEKMRELYKQQTKTRDVFGAYRSTLRDSARLETFHEKIIDATEGLKALPAIKFPTFKPDEKREAVLLFSDLHLGAQINNFYNHYNVEIAKKRVAKLISDTIAYCKMYKVKRLTVLNLGDLIAGILHINARIEQETDVVRQIMAAAEIMAEALNKLQSAAPEIIYRSCTDNHSRVSANLKEHIECENFGKIIDFYLEERLKKTKVVFANDNLDDDIGLFKLLNGENFAFVHGHRDNYTTSFQAFCGATQQFIHYIAMGHYHNSKVKSFQGAKVFVNGSIVGSDTYAQSKRLYGPAEQTLLIFDNKNVSVNYINVDIKE